MNIRTLVLVLLTLVASMSVHAAQTVKEFSGTGNATTAIFTVESPWLLDWRLDGDYDKLMALDVTLVEAHSGRHVGRILHTQRRGNGLKLFKKGGQYQLRISSTLARWRFKVEQILPEDEKLYEPKTGN